MKQAISSVGYNILSAGIIAALFSGCLWATEMLSLKTGIGSYDDFVAAWALWSLAASIVISIIGIGIGALTGFAIPSRKKPV